MQMCAINKKDQTINLNKPKASKSNKYKEIIKPIWYRNKPKAGIAFGSTLKTGITPGTKGKGVTPIILPNDPNELVKMLSLRMPAYEAGNTGAGNEAVAICDELFRQGAINKKTYKEHMKCLSQV